MFKLGIEYNEERKPKKRAKWLEKYLKTQEEHHAKMINRANLFYPNMPETKQLEIEKILEAGKNELADIEKERKLAHAKNIAGAALEIGSAFIPGVNGLKATTTIAKALTPLVGKKIAATTAKNAIDGALLSSVYGLGEGLLEDKNLIENTVDNAMLGGITGGVFGLGFGRLKKHIAKSKILSNPENKELVDEFIIDYVDGLINKKQALAEARGLRLGVDKGTHSNILDEISDEEMARRVKQWEILAKNLRTGKNNPKKVKKKTFNSSKITSKEKEYVFHVIDTHISQAEKEKGIAIRRLYNYDEEKDFIYNILYDNDGNHIIERIDIQNDIY